MKLNFKVAVLTILVLILGVVVLIAFKLPTGQEQQVAYDTINQPNKPKPITPKYGTPSETATSNVGTSSESETVTRTFYDLWHPDFYQTVTIDKDAETAKALWDEVDVTKIYMWDHEVTYDTNLGESHATMAENALILYMKLMSIPISEEELSTVFTPWATTVLLEERRREDEYLSQPEVIERASHELGLTAEECAQLETAENIAKTEIYNDHITVYYDFVPYRIYFYDGKVDCIFWKNLEADTLTDGYGYCYAPLEASDRANSMTTKWIRERIEIEKRARGE